MSSKLLSKPGHHQRPCWFGCAYNATWTHFAYILHISHYVQPLNIETGPSVGSPGFLCISHHIHHKFYLTDNKTKLRKMNLGWRHQMETFFALLHGSLWGESTGHRWIPLIKASDAELWCFLWSAPEQTIEQTIETPMIWDAVALIMTSP